MPDAAQCCLASSHRQLLLGGFNIEAGRMQLKMGSAVVSTALVGVPPTNWQHSPWRTIR
jgi:hypothetical protein